MLARAVRRRRLRILGQDASEILSLHAVLKAKRSHHPFDFCFAGIPEELSVLLKHRFREQYVAHQELYMTLGPEGEGIIFGVLLGEEPFEWLHEVSDLSVPSPPVVDAQTGLLLKDRSYVLYPGRARRGVHHLRT